eukprot:GHRR01007241.1.p1 GENE.GHRR01007241.1~~GHRR01007241.1.p1  ORF type:complete len:225 (+),score=58.57 GHRR01007241.1:959-1633(+)
MTWIFGYGSLVYKPGFAHKQKVTGYIKGYKRVFWQGSTDHRGTPEAPGRTVTLQENNQALTWGVAYELAGSEAEQQDTIKYLEWREKQYDIRTHCDIFTPDSPDVPVVKGALLYIASNSPKNINWLGPAPLQAIAEQIARAVGPSGHNHEYLFKLAAAMRQFQVEDPELFELEALVLQLIQVVGTATVQATVTAQAAAHTVGVTAVQASAAVEAAAGLHYKLQH